MKLDRSWGLLDMNSEWKKVKLSEITTIIGDGLHGTPQYDENGEYYFINGNNLQDGKIVIKEDTKRVSFEEYSKYKKDLNDRTIFVSINGTIGNIGTYNNEKVILGKSACYFNVDKNNDTDFIQYVVTNKKFKDYIQHNATGTTIKNVSLKLMRDYEFILPPIRVQKKIASVLKSLDSKISCNNQINDNLGNLLQVIYKQHFACKNIELLDGCLADICEYSRDRIAVSYLSLDNYYSTENMLPGKGGAVQATSLPTINQTTKCKGGDVLISNIRPYFKKIVYCYEECGCSTDVLCFTPKKLKYSAFLFSTLYADRFFEYMVAGSKGTKMPRGDKQQIMTYPVQKPSDEELSSFNEIAKPILLNIENNKTENLRLSVLRDTLLPLLMSGELDISEISI